jgi:hypothetical protein
MFPRNQVAVDRAAYNRKTYNAGAIGVDAHRIASPPQYHGPCQARGAAYFLDQTNAINFCVVWAGSARPRRAVISQVGGGLV